MILKSLSFPTKGKLSVFMPKTEATRLRGKKMKEIMAMFFII